MNIQSAEFITSLDIYKPLTNPPLPEIATAGRSNVGKSTLINRLTNRKNLARVSGTPGKTRLLNVYQINGKLNLVDLPGYGFARAAKTEIAAWSRRVDGYFANTQSLALVLHLVDIRHEPTADDISMTQYLRRADVPFITVATKADKISRPKQGAQVHLIARTLQVQPWEIIVFSGETGLGCENVWKVIENAECGMQNAEL